MSFNIQMVDLQRQNQRLKGELDPAIRKVIDSAYFINGPEVSIFAKNLSEYLNVKHVIPVANGTEALQIALMALDIGSGDEVITPDFTFAATVEAVSLLGAKPVLIDVNIDDYNLNTDLLESLITEKTKAIIPVHLFGQCANMDRIIEIAKKYNISVIEDAAQALGTDYCGELFQGKAGTLGDIGCTSFFPSKNLGCFGDGGAVFTNSDNLASSIKAIANHGSKVKYYHDRIGVNSRLDTIQAAILDVKLKHLDDFNSRRKIVADYYDEHLSSCPMIKTPMRNIFSTHIFHQYSLTLQDGGNIKLQQWLKEKQIPSMIYYPLPIHKQKAFNQETNSDSSFPVSRKLAESIISLPMHTEMTEEELNYITLQVHTYFETL